MNIVDSTEKSKIWGMEIPVYCMVMHLSPLLNFLVPVAGIVAPLVMWGVNKDKDARIDANGKILINWYLSFLIYLIPSFILSFVVIGVFMIITLGVSGIVFMVLGAVKASQDKVWPYPLSIKFLDVPKTLTTEEPSVA